MKNDDDLKRAVLVRLQLDPGLDVASLDIAVNDRVVILGGLLHNEEERARTERAVKLVPGVKGLVDRIRIEAPEPDPPSDREVSAKAAEALQYLTTVPIEEVIVSAQNGWVTLKGTVDTPRQRAILEDILRHLSCAKGVNNLLNLRNPGPPKITQAA